MASRSSNLNIDQTSHKLINISLFMNQNPQYLITVHDDCYPIHECQSSFAPTLNTASHSQAAMMNYSIPLLRVLNRSRIPLLLFNYMFTCFPCNFDGHEQQRHEGTWKAKPKQTRQLSELVLVLMSQHLTAQLSPVSLLPVLYPTGSEI